jgi:hypothetical protein
MYYLAAQVQSEMSPMMFIVFAPIVALPVFALALVIELFLTKVWWRPKTAVQGFTLGLSYSLVLLWLLHPLLVVVAVVANPIFVRYWFSTRAHHFQN